jgi:hypothetical protein
LSRTSETRRWSPPTSARCATRLDPPARHKAKQKETHKQKQEEKYHCCDFALGTRRTAAKHQLQTGQINNLQFDSEKKNNSQQMKKNQNKSLQPIKRNDSKSTLCEDHDCSYKILFWTIEQTNRKTRNGTHFTVHLPDPFLLVSMQQSN